MINETTGIKFSCQFDEKNKRKQESVDFLNHVYNFKCKHDVNTYAQECAECKKDKRA